MKLTCKPVVNKPANWLQRTADCWLYVIVHFERRMSPGIRAWVKTNARLALFIAAPTFMVLPVATMALWELEAWVNSLTTIASKLIVLPILVLLALVSITVVCRILSAFKR